MNYACDGVKPEVALRVFVDPKIKDEQEARLRGCGLSSIPRAAPPKPEVGLKQTLEARQWSRFIVLRYN